MTKHKSVDYKLVAINYHLQNKSKYTNTCEIFNCSERSLKSWICKYNKTKTITRKNRKSISYKITKNKLIMLHHCLKIINKLL